jgi:hypothetical protein
MVEFSIDHWFDAVRDQIAIAFIYGLCTRLGNHLGPRHNDELILKAMPSYIDYTNLRLAALVSHPPRSLDVYRHVAEALLLVTENVEVIDGAWRDNDACMTRTLRHSSFLHSAPA